MGDRGIKLWETGAEGAQRLHEPGEPPAVGQKAGGAGAPGGGAAQPPATPREGYLIGVVDHDPASRKLFQRFLSRRPEFHPHTFADAEQALLWALDAKPDMLLVNQEMPQMSGYLFLDLLRNAEGGNHTPVCMITVDEEQAHHTLGRQLGVSKVLRKPIPMPELISCIERVAKARQG